MDGNGAACPIDTTGRRVGDNDCLVAGGKKRGREFTHTAYERGIDRQCRLAVTAAELDSAGVSRGFIAVRVLSGDGEVGRRKGSACRSAVWCAGDGELGRRAC